ncbi:PEP-CTERM sorting domain-containing protein [Colwellia psychrerythraea]|uniref:PEP motif putative anchor domain protein n=1 Tax=Colwellia psychrerythraea TaxID=28229 RepID=A0A099L578_COLPS|nr:PEP-CTERM sorting domain-containing protein [Colwellia psychrerythraea]KGJ97327.1 PEP motif putative anchor domain protein [Colwellia psychrerythraea]
MNLLKTFAAASAIAIASFAADASQIQSGGITWDPDYTSFDTDFFAAAKYKQYYVASGNGSLPAGTIFDNTADLAIGDKVQGFGVINELNGQNAGQYCVTCTQLTFSYTDFFVTATTGAGAPLFTGGTAGFYVNDGAALNGSSTYADASNGTLWLDLVSSSAAHDFDNGSVVDTTNTYLDVVGGLVASNFDTNTLDFGADLAFSGSIHGASTSQVGTAHFVGNSIPEPTSLAIFGLGLLGLAGAARRKA